MIDVFCNRSHSESGSIRSSSGGHLTPPKSNTVDRSDAESISTTISQVCWIFNISPNMSYDFILTFQDSRGSNGKTVINTGSVIPMDGMVTPTEEAPVVLRKKQENPVTNKMQR
jgi:hypothetical protein